MYERSAIVLERYFEKLFNFNKQNNLRENYKNYSEIIANVKEYQKITEEEESIIEKFEEIATKIESVQKRQRKLYEGNVALENVRDRYFNDLSENPNNLENKIKKVENKIEANNEELKKLRDEYVRMLTIFEERQKERNRVARERRKVEATYIEKAKKGKEVFKNIDQKDAIEIKKFISAEKEEYKQIIINEMLKNGKNEKVPFNSEVIEKAAEARLEVAEKEAELYISVYDKMKKILTEIEADNLKLAHAEKVVRDTTVKMNFLEAKKEYIVSFLDNERMTVINGQKAHEQIMKDACENFETDIHQINNLYELVVKETMGKSTKKAYRELYNKTYLRDMQEKEKNFEREMIGLRANVGTLINFNYWRIEGIKNVYETFEREITEKFDKDLSEFKLEEKIEDSPKDIYDILSNTQDDDDINESDTYDFEDEEKYEFEEDEDDEYESEDEEDEDEEEDEYELEDEDEDEDEYESEDEDEEEDEYESDDEEEEEYEIDDEDEYESDEEYEFDDDFEDEEDYDEYGFDDEEDEESEYDFEEDEENEFDNEDYEKDEDEFNDEDIYKFSLDDEEDDDDYFLDDEKYEYEIEYKEDDDNDIKEDEKLKRGKDKTNKYQESISKRKKEKVTKASKKKEARKERELQDKEEQGTLGKLFRRNGKKEIKRSF